MSNNEFSDIINNVDNLTIGQILKLFKKLKYKTLITIISFFIMIFASTFAAGRYSQFKETAVMLQKPFAMRINLDNKSYDFNSLTLIKDPAAPNLNNDKIILSLREIKSPFDIIQVGTVIATIENNSITGIWKVILTNKIDIINNAFAQTAFDWNGHQDDFNFNEKFVNKNSVHRFYSDGCILAYSVDANRRSIPSSFKWIKMTH